MQKSFTPSSIGIYHFSAWRNDNIYARTIVVFVSEELKEMLPDIESLVERESVMWKCMVICCYY
jgi:hypothetical protein